MARRYHFVSRSALRSYLARDTPHRFEPATKGDNQRIFICHGTNRAADYWKELTNAEGRLTIVAMPGCGKTSLLAAVVLSQLRAAVAPRPRGERLLACLLSEHLQEAILGDLQEGFERIWKERGAREAEQWWRRHAIRSVVPLFFAQLWRQLLRRLVK
jgi:hypothetical protein